MKLPKVPLLSKFRIATIRPAHALLATGALAAIVVLALQVVPKDQKKAAVQTAPKVRATQTKTSNTDTKQAKAEAAMPAEPETAKSSASTSSKPVASNSTPPAPQSSTRSPYTPPVSPFLVSTVSATATASCFNTNITSVYASASAVYFQSSNNPGGTLSWRWEVEGDTSDMSGIDTTTHAEQVPANRISFVPGGNMLPGNINGFTTGFRMRLHVITPNDIASVWSNIPATQCP